MVENISDSRYDITHFLLGLFIIVYFACSLEKEFIVKKLLGEGGFGVVVHASHKIDGRQYAIKIVKLPQK